MVTASLHAFCLKLGMPMEFECHFTVISRLICLETRFVLPNLVRYVLQHFLVHMACSDGDIVETCLPSCSDLEC